jgi:hypothetical protein
MALDYLRLYEGLQGNERTALFGKTMVVAG